MDDADFASVYNRHKTAIYRFCLRMLGDRDEASDVAQEVFVKFLESPVSLDGDGRRKMWLFKSARNRCLNVIRDRKGKSNLGDSQDESELLASTDREYAGSEEIVARLFREMPLEYREILILREWSELNYDEIAEAMETTVSAVKSKLFKARKKAREIYEKLYGEK